ncbi:MAG: hypothetical protein OXI34_16100 [Chloroflexota bacterium]|nr:hypothetical protein [Chloroflexota bacterium]MDE2945522.1 hypothetical protein [Chloroflexota bacterium]
MDGPKLKPAPLENVEADDDDREPTKEEIMDDIRQGLRDVLAGYEGQDAMEFLDELEREAMVDADES